MNSQTCPFAPCLFFPFHSFCQQLPSHQAPCSALPLASATLCANTRQKLLSLNLTVPHLLFILCILPGRSQSQQQLPNASLYFQLSLSPDFQNHRLVPLPEPQPWSLTSLTSTDEFIIFPCICSILCIHCHDQCPLCPSNYSSQKPGSHP